MTNAIELTPAVLDEMPLPQPGADTDKRDRGRILLVAGGEIGPGAALLAGRAALRAGAGQLQLAATSAVAAGLALAIPEAAVLIVDATDAGDIALSAVERLGSRLAGVECVVVGPGMMNEGEAGALAMRLLAAAPQAAFLIDAAAMTDLASEHGAGPLCGGRTVLTPHPGELCRLLGCEIDAVKGDMLGHARAAARRFNAVVALKSRETVIAAPDGTAWRHSRGVAGLATAGSGDVLAGVIGGLLARGAPPVAAAAWGVYLHAQAGRRLENSVGPLGFLASELAEEIPGLMHLPY